MPDFDPPRPDEPETPVNADDQEEPDMLSPSVRRLVKQYDLDITGIHGSGPAGRIRTADIMAALGGRAAPAAQGGGEAGAAEEAEAAPRESLAASFSSVQTVRSFVRHHPASTVFECDLTNVLAHQAQMRERNRAVAPTAYYVVALVGAIDRCGHDDARESGGLGVVMPAADGRKLRRILLETPLELTFETINTRLLAPEDEDTEEATWLIDHHGLGGSIVALPTPLGEAQRLSLGIGKLRRVFSFQQVDGVDTPRVVPQCYLSLSFHPDETELQEANQLLGTCVEILEGWRSDRPPLTAPAPLPSSP